MNIVSIHAPAWGATQQQRAELLSHAVSIHAPAWGATYYEKLIGLMSVSIHAPAWGATRYLIVISYNFSVSIHAPAWGATITWTIWLSPPRLFQSTRPHGARRLNNTVKDNLKHVSIHAPAWGATQKWGDKGLFEALVSIHAPAWGATYIHLISGLSPLVSIHAPAWGATVNLSRLAIALDRFQSTRPHGARRAMIIWG